MTLLIEGKANGRRLAVAAAIVAAVLLVPLVAMQFTDEVRWTALDFAVAAMLLGGTAIGVELALRRFRGSQRVVVVGAVMTVAALLWAQGAVGIV